MELNLNDGDARQFINTLLAVFSDISPALPEIGEILVSSIATNFEVGGRHGGANEFGGSDAQGTWIPSKRAIRDSGQTLVDTARLSSSIVYEVSGNQILVGTNVEYAAIHQFGGMTGRGHAVNIVARPYLVIQNEDLREIDLAIANHYARRLQAALG